MDIFILISRPSGKVTNLLFSGLILTHVSMLLDFIDEFVIYPSNNHWLASLDSAPAPIGMVIMSYALYQWHLEQLSINAQLRNTERFYRDHSLTDFTTGLYSAKYMKAQLQREILNTRNKGVLFSVMLIDIRQFDAFNRQYGDTEGDILLREIAQTILMNLRENDLACRYASDRFIILLPDTLTQTAVKMSKQIESSVEHLAFKVGTSTKAEYQHVTSCVITADGSNDYTEILEQLNNRIQVAKQQHLNNEQRTAA